MVPYLLAHPGVPLADAARDFDVSESQLRRDLELLWMCGLPGHGPRAIELGSGTIMVTFDAGMSRPLRLTAEEALALVVALRTLAETPGLADHEAIERALAKVETAAGGSVVRNPRCSGLVACAITATGVAGDMPAAMRLERKASARRVPM